MWTILTNKGCLIGRDEISIRVIEIRYCKLDADGAIMQDEEDNTLCKEILPEEVVPAEGFNLWKWSLKPDATCMVKGDDDCPDGYIIENSSEDYCGVADMDEPQPPTHCYRKVYLGR